VKKFNFGSRPWYGGGEGVVVLVGRARRARRHAQTGFGGLSETALPYPLESPLTKGDTRRSIPKPIASHFQEGEIDSPGYLQSSAKGY